jgi:hypothetical protein
MSTNIERQLKSLKLNFDATKVKMEFAQITTQEPPEDDEEGESVISVDTFIVKSKKKPHPDLIKCLKKMRKHALELMEIKLADEAKDLQDWTVLGIKIDGDVLKKQSRLVMTVGKWVSKTEKVLEWPITQVTMYPEKDDVKKYHDIDKLTTIVEDIIEECWSYCFLAKFDQEGQLSLFPTAEKVEEEEIKMKKAV